MRSWRWYSKVLFALLVAAFAYWVWPTPWHYEHAVVPRFPAGRATLNVLVRVNRLSGTTCYWNPVLGLWQERGPVEEVPRR